MTDIFRKLQEDIIKLAKSQETDFLPLIKSVYGNTSDAVLEGAVFANYIYENDSKEREKILLECRGELRAKGSRKHIQKFNQMFPKMKYNPNQGLWEHCIPEKEIRDQLISKSLDPKYFDYTDVHGGSLLHPAAFASSSLECVEYLLSLGFDPNNLNDDGESSLHASVSRINQCSVEITDCLIKKGADVNIRTKSEGHTPLHISAGWNKEIKVTQLLVEAGANLDAQDNHGNTPLHLISVETCSFEIEQYLLKSGANPNITNNQGQLYIKNRRRTNIKTTNQERIDAVWAKAKKIRGESPDIYRRDSKGNRIRYASYGKQGDFGWEIDHIYPRAKGGQSSLSNLQPLQSKENKRISDKTKNKVTMSVIKNIYPIAMDVYEERKTLKDGVNQLVEEVGMNKGNAWVYIRFFVQLKEGELHRNKMSANLMATSYFLEKILADDGKDGLKVALKSLRMYIEYAEEVFRSSSLIGLRKICEEFSEKL